MRRTRRRTSRILVSVLIFVVLVGLYATFKSGGDRAPEQQISGAIDATLVATTDNAQRRPEQVALTPLLAVTETPSIPSTPLSPLPPPVDTAKPQAEAAKGDAASQPPAAQPVSEAQTVPVAPVASVGVVPVVSTGRPLQDARGHFEAGDFLGARRLLNDVFLSGQLPDHEQADAKKLLLSVGEQVVFTRKVHKDDAFSTTYTVRPGEVLQKIARAHDVTWELLCRVNGLADPRKMRAGQTLKVVKGPFHAVVSKRAFTMDIYLGSPGEAGAVLVASFPVGLGADDSTPTGRWVVEPNKKIKNPTYYSPRGEGIIEADDPKNPLGEYWIALAGLEGQAVGKSSYGIHGTIEPDSIGKEESMGCIRLRHEDVTRVFELLMDGKSVVVVKE